MDGAWSECETTGDRRNIKIEQKRVASETSTEPARFLEISNQLLPLLTGFLRRRMIRKMINQ